LYGSVQSVQQAGRAWISWQHYCMEIEAVFWCSLGFFGKVFFVVCTTAICHRFRGVERGQGHTTVYIFWAHFSRKKFGTVGCCKLFLLDVNALLLLIYIS
jgi:hypothetical protein